MFIDDNKDLAELCRKFVCLKFCERDDRDEYYRAAGYFVSQWYWQPILGICWPDGREINVHWRRTHEALPVADAAKILREALKVAGEGIDPALAAKARALCGEAEAALELQDFDRAEKLANEAAASVPRGGARADGERIAKKARFLRDTKTRLERLQSAGDESAAAGDLAAAMSLCLAGAAGESLDVLASAGEAQGATAEAARWFRPALLEHLRGSIEVLRVSHERFRHGASLFHEIRCELRNLAGAVEGLTVQYSVLLDDGRVYAGWEEYGKAAGRGRVRGATLLPAAEAVPPERIADIRVEVLLRGETIAARRWRAGEPGEDWWKRAEVRPLYFHGDGGGWWASPGLSRTGANGVRFGAPAKVLDLAPPSPFLPELQAIFAELDGNRFQASSRVAFYRLIALGPGAVPAWAPLAHRYGGYTTSQLLAALARVRGGEAAAALLHIVGADDVTIKYPAFQQVRWLEGREDVPVAEVIGYLESGEGDVKDLAARVLGMIGRKEGFLPVLAWLRSSAAGTGRAEQAVAAIADLTGRHFGLDPSKPLAEQGEAVKRIAEWWKAGAEKDARAVWMAQALEEAGFGEGGALVEACRAGNAGAAEPFVAKALASGKPRSIRCALLVAKDLGTRALAPSVLDLFLKMDARDPNLGLARNALRDFMDAETLGKLIAALEDPAKLDVVLDFLLVVTGKHDFYPVEAGGRMGKAEREAYQRKWADWFEDNRDRLKWDPAEGRFVAGG